MKALASLLGFEGTAQRAVSLAFSRLEQSSHPVACVQASGPRLSAHIRKEKMGALTADRAVLRLAEMEKLFAAPRRD
jgi:hypothetical protein